MAVTGGKVAEAVAVNVATQAVVWVGGIALLIYVVPKVLSFLTGELAKGAGNLAVAGGKAVGTVAAQLNPTSRENIVYRTVNGVGAGATGNDSFTLGSWLYDLVNGAEDDRLASGTPAPRRTTQPATRPAPTPAPSSGGVLDSISRTLNDWFPGFGAN